MFFCCFFYVGSAGGGGLEEFYEVYHLMTGREKREESGDGVGGDEEL